MKNGKRILSVKVKRMLDDSPDTSHLGEYSMTRKSEFSIDRAHSLDCSVNTGAKGLLWYTSGSGRIELQMTVEQAQSVSHFGQCDEDVAELAKVPAIKAQLDVLDPALISAELKEYGAWDAKELSDHAQNLQRILWLAGGDIPERGGCDCGERGDMGRNEYRYFNPSFNYVDKADNPQHGLIAQNVHKYVRQDYERMESLAAGNWCYIGIQAQAQIGLGDVSQYPKKYNVTLQTIISGGLWGIESDSDAAYLESEEKEQLADLRNQLLMLGFSRRAISTAFKNVEHETE